MRILIMGGSIFLGRAITQEALRRGHEVTTFNRGRSGVDLPGVEAVKGDREVPEDLDRLVAGREWDAVIDVHGQVPRVVGESVRRLGGRAGTYAYISSISAISDFPERECDESSPRYECAPDAGPEDGHYGILKAGCERAVEGFDGNALIIQPGLILGPYENVGRLPWWLDRISRGGRVLAPGDPDRAMQLIDARDIAAFVLTHAEAGTADRFLTSGVRGNITYGGWLAECRAATGSDAEFVWVDDRFLLDREVSPWSEFPVWTPGGPEFAGVWLPSSAKAIAAGLTCRPVAETVRDTWAWLGEVPPGERAFRGHGIDPEKEAGILAEWA
ncbi:NAD-dependent epimerase/dehydratase family protein [Streptosporangium sp. NBC_01755]|uniref:NAD-dependent epimerase/dehydratase family protein n=1 Tax=unclassified Streptosporangium TaxID=2632669 RepID=UPI002DDAFDA9|nr:MULTISPECIES: NAD-dependent epimerase/dehydratase family protein [unclassified Streptosporangium]WSA27337.1 NAD-dependent epimerase/dehydratase family protein [Streptosporangium sp. NBC_01810]WSD01090.1 NAD-dependent epimerase/dehydratase family protein [Streptosporangium sp. NBC_01755]